MGTDRKWVEMSAEEHSIPPEMRGKYGTITGITDEFCREHLNEEYAELARKMAAALSAHNRTGIVGMPRVWLRSWSVTSYGK